MSILKPTALPAWATDLSEVTEPTAPKKVQGWLTGEAPPNDWMNWLHNTTFEWTDWLDRVFDMTVAGELQLKAHLHPGTDSTYTLGTGALRWSSIFADAIDTASLNAASFLTTPFILCDNILNNNPAPVASSTIDIDPLGPDAGNPSGPYANPRLLNPTVLGSNSAPYGRVFAEDVLVAQKVLPDTDGGAEIGDPALQFSAVYSQDVQVSNDVLPTTDDGGNSIGLQTQRFSRSYTKRAVIDSAHILSTDTQPVTVNAVNHGPWQLNQNTQIIAMCRVRMTSGGQFLKDLTQPNFNIASVQNFYYEAFDSPNIAVIGHTALGACRIQLTEHTPNKDYVYQIQQYTGTASEAIIKGCLLSEGAGINSSLTDIQAKKIMFKTVSLTGDVTATVAATPANYIGLTDYTDGDILVRPLLWENEGGVDGWTGPRQIGPINTDITLTPGTVFSENFSPDHMNFTIIVYGK